MIYKHISMYVCIGSGVCVCVYIYVCVHIYVYICVCLLYVYVICGSAVVVFLVRWFGISIDHRLGVMYNLHVVVAASA